MSEKTVLIMADGSRWHPSTSRDVVQCATCSNEVDTPEEIASYPGGTCPKCGSPWTGGENRSTIINVTMPQGITGGAG
jgi:Zn finger protein HypA/HybF involved in hydrogenase expression